MVNCAEFDEIRPYHDDELPAIYEELIADEAFREAVKTVIPEVPFEILAQQMRQCKTKLEFQKTFCYPALWKLVRNCANGMDLDYSAIAEKGRAYTYISNHRDIVLDSGFLSVLLVEEGLDTVEIAIGDNLLIYPWIKKFVRINKSFIVQRTLSMRQKLEASARMSRYIHHTIREKRQSVWIAQREGRAKDSNDLTQESVLKMLAMGSTAPPIESLMELNIVPLAISYEYDPCDYLKAREFQQKRDNPDYKKPMEEDLLNMKTGLFGYKGRIHFQVAGCINPWLESLDKELPKNEFYELVAAHIDRNIHHNYRLYPCNYIAYDLLYGNRRFATHYTGEEKEEFERYVAGQTDKIDLPGKDTPFLREKMLEMYANPLCNYLKAKE